MAATAVSVRETKPPIDIGGRFRSVSRRNPPRIGGTFGASAKSMLAFSPEETSMTYPLIPERAEVRLHPFVRLDALIDAARADVVRADAEVAMAIAKLEGVEPHIHAHGHTAGGDCLYSGFRADHLEPLAGLLARPWRPMLAAVELVRTMDGLDYLLKAFPVYLDEARAPLADAGRARLNELRDLVTDRQPPILAIGMVWHAFGFHHRDRHAWVGLFAFPDALSQLVTAADGITKETSLGAALTATVHAHTTMLTEVGTHELNRRAEQRDAERQASWAAVSAAYREHGSWRGWAPTKRQGHLMRRIEAARGLPMPALPRRGDASDWIGDAGGNPRFSSLRKG